MHRVSTPAPVQAAEVGERSRRLGFPNISQNRSGCPNPGGQATAAESIERVHRKLFLEQLRGIFGVERGQGLWAEPWSAQSSQAGSGICRGAVMKYFPWLHPSQFVHELALCLYPLELDDPKLSSGQVQRSQSNDGELLGGSGRGMGEGDGR